VILVDRKLLQSIVSSKGNWLSVKEMRPEGRIPGLAATNDRKPGAGSRRTLTRGRQLQACGVLVTARGCAANNARRVPAMAGA